MTTENYRAALDAAVKEYETLGASARTSTGGSRTWRKRSGLYRDCSD
jgi:hypothetical protein